MAFFNYLCQDYLYTSENEAYTKVKKILDSIYSSDEEKHCLLLGNFSCMGSEIDAVIVKNDAIVVVEFKNYGGKITFSEAGNWLNEDTIIKGGAGNRNPFQQVRINKYALLENLRDYVGLQNVDLGHISGIVLFQNPIEFDEYSIPRKLSSWFHIVDMENFQDKIQNITSPKIRIKPDEFTRIISRLNIDPFFVFPQITQPQFETPIIEDDKPSLIVKSDEFVEEKIIKTEARELPVDNSGVKSFSLWKLGFNVAHSVKLAKREGEYCGVDDIGLHKNVAKVLKKYKGQVYKHQHAGLKLYTEGKNVCMATSTSSGKSEVFYWSAIDLLSKDEDAKIIAIYPMKALGRQQEERWTKVLKEANSGFGVTRIDGSVKDRNERLERIKNRENRVLIMTPDVIHAWLLKSLDEPRIKKFLSNVKMVVLDEIHNYKGVFGSNSAFLIRRLNHAFRVLGKRVPQYISASATIKSPEVFLKKLTGMDFELVDISLDTSPKHEIDVHMIDNGDSKDMLPKVANLINFFAQETDYQSITFVDSRKMVEQFTVIARRLAAGKKGLDDNTEIDESEDLIKEIEEYGIYPYRAGYEEDDTKTIQKKLHRGQLKGVISTSALEVGIDIAGLDLGILVGIPGSATSLAQRIGRIGRHKDGMVFIINDGSFRSQIMFQNAEKILNLPWEEGALYLDNENIQYIHALCFAGPNGEFEKLAGQDSEFETEIEFPKNFLDICIAERIGQVPKQVQHFKTMIEESPNTTFPLRDVEPQFQVNLKIPGGQNNMGSLSLSQMMRETYPHAIYYYAGKPYRVKKILKKNREIQVTKSRYYTTQPVNTPTIIKPNLRPDNIYQVKKYENLVITECNLEINENIIGVVERRGGAEPINISYPFSVENSEYTERFFSRRYFTSGVVIFAPELPQDTKILDALSQILFEVFLVVIPFESQDIHSGRGKLKADFLEMGTGTPFISIYDQTYGSLRLTQYLMDSEILLKVFKRALEVVDDKWSSVIPEQFKSYTGDISRILGSMLQSVNGASEYLNFGEELQVARLDGEAIEIIRPYKGFIAPTRDWEQSKGMDPLKNNEFFLIEKIDRFSRNGRNDYCYYGYYESQIRIDENNVPIVEKNQAITILDLKTLTPSVDSARALFNPETQDITLI